MVQALVGFCWNYNLICNNRYTNYEVYTFLGRLCFTTS